MKHTFIHISDLHFRPDWPEEVGLVCNKFLEDLKKQVGKLENPYLVFSGDIVNSGEDAHHYSEFTETFGKALDDTGISRDRRICVPGNHDASRSALTPLLTIQKGTLSEMSDERTFNDTFAQLSKMFFAETFANFVNFEPTFASTSCCQDGLGGTGWELDNGLGVYCMNTALSSFAGLADQSGIGISDKQKLVIHTRPLHKWIANTQPSTRVLVMHHPLDWLTDWARKDLERTIAAEFALVLSGHVHDGDASYHACGAGASVCCSAPPLFTKKADLLGYAIVTLDARTKQLEVRYRQWSGSSRNFVAGTILAGNDLGIVNFPTEAPNSVTTIIDSSQSIAVDRLALLQAEFEEAVTCYSSKKCIWVDRHLADSPETRKDYKDGVEITIDDLVERPRSCVLSAPREFGLTCVGRYLAYEHQRRNSDAGPIVMVDARKLPTHKGGIQESFDRRCDELDTATTDLSGIIIDHWQNNAHGRRVLREIRDKCSECPLILFQTFEDFTAIAEAVELEELKDFETWYLWSLAQSEIRQLVSAYTEDIDHLDEAVVTRKITQDIDALNIHRTPMNCLLILKYSEQALDDSPVNRTQLIDRVLSLLFYQFDKIPQYATRPDLMDCEYALGYLCEWLIREERASFTKSEFFRKVAEYCNRQLLDLDCEVLFGFLATENILIRKGTQFQFRFSYWLFFFAAHRMHHSPEFCQFILSHGRYAAFPEIMEFYTGIDRRRADAVIQVKNDLARMSAELLQRTQIPADFDPFREARWNPTEESLRLMEQEVSKSVAESSLPAHVKDAIADKQYDRARPYDQEIAEFIRESSLVQMMQAIKGAARALRNSDHVSPDIKAELLEELIKCWIHVCQVIALLSPLLAEKGAAIFEGIHFHLSETWDEIESREERWELLMRVIVDNVVDFYQEDIFSRKMGALLADYVSKHEGIGPLLVLLLMARQRPPNWQRTLEQFIVASDKNAFALGKVFASLRRECKVSFASEQTLQELKRLTAMSVAKHKTGKRHPDKALIERAAKALGFEVPDREAGTKTRGSHGKRRRKRGRKTTE